MTETQFKRKAARDFIKGEFMKKFILCLLTVCSVQLNAAPNMSMASEQNAESILTTLGDVFTSGYLVPGRPRPPRPQPYPGNPYQPPRPPPPGGGGGYYPPPSNPGYGVTCTSNDNGHEEHYGGHYSCGECLSQHGSCTETCSSQMTECQVQGVDRYGRTINFLGRGDSRWRAEDDAMRNCYYNANNCYVTSCQERNNVVSRRSCR